MFKLISLLGAFFILVGVNNTVYAATQQENLGATITIALPDKRNIPPYLWYNPCVSSEPRGYAQNILRKIFTKMGFNYTFHRVKGGNSEPSNSLSLIKNFSYDAMTLPSYINTPDVISIPEPLYTVGFNIFIPIDNTKDFIDVSSLKDKRGIVYTIRGSIDTYVKQSPENLNRLSASSDFGFIFKQLIENKIDYVIASKAIGGGYISHPEFKGKIVSSGISFGSPVGIYLVLNRHGPLKKYFGEINNEIIDIKSTGEANLLLRKNMYLGLAENTAKCKSP